MGKSNQHFVRPDLLCIGFLCHDLHEERHILGGTASYSSLMANHLGVQTAILTSVGEDFEFYDIFEQKGIPICNKPAVKTTVFENIYLKGKRTQYIHNRSQTLFPTDLPPSWKEAPIVKFCLIADEVDFSLLQAFPNALVGATIQGWLREWDKNGKVFSKAMDWEKLQSVDIVFMSEDDIAGYETAIPRISELVELLIMTKGRDGAVIFHKGKQLEFPAFPVKEVDPTGAGDIFASSFLVKYQKTKNIALSAAFAHAAASFIVEDYGIKIPPNKAINQRFIEYVAHFIPSTRI